MNLKKVKAGNGFSGLKMGPKLEESTLGLIVYDAEGNRNVVVPQFKEEFIYSKSNFYVDGENNLVGIFCKHKKAESNYSNNMAGIVREGVIYGFYKWNLIENELILHEEQRVYNRDIFNDAAKEQMKVVDPKGKMKTIDFEAEYDNSSTFDIEYLPTGDYLLTFEDVGSDSRTNYSTFYMCLDENGKKKWGNFHGNMFTEVIRNIGVNSEKNHYLLLSTGRSANYASSDYKITTDKGKADVVCLTVLDLETGETILRKSYHPIEKRHFKSGVYWNEEAQAIMMVMEEESSSSSLSRKVQYGVLDYRK